MPRGIITKVLLGNTKGDGKRGLRIQAGREMVATEAEWTSGPLEDAREGQRVTFEESSGGIARRVRLAD